MTESSRSMCQNPDSNSTSSVPLSSESVKPTTAHKVLLVADEIGNLLHISAVLRAGGYDVEICSEGAEVLQTAKQADPDVCILASSMGRWDACTIASELKRDEQTCDLPMFLIVRSWTEVSYCLQREEAGAIDDLMVPPFEDQELLVRVRGLLRLRQIWRRLRRRETELLALQHISSASSGLSKIEMVLEVALRTVLDILGIESGAVYLLRDQGKTLEIVLTQGEISGLRKLLGRFPVEGFVSTSESLDRDVAQLGQPAVFRVCDFPYPVLRAALISEGYEIVGGIPLIARGHLLGVIGFGSRRPRLFPEADLQLLEAIGRQVGLALQSTELHEALEKERDFARMLLDTMAEGILVADATGTITFMNPAFCRLLSVKPADLLGARVSDVVSESEWNKLEVGLTGKSELAGPHEMTLIAADGRRIPVIVNATTLLEDEELAGILVVFTDITAVKEAEQALLRTERLRALGQMAGGIAHNFNNILAGIQGFLDLAKADIHDRAALLDDLRHIELGTRDAAQAVRRLQSLYRTFGDTSDFISIDLNDLVEEVLMLTRPHWGDDPQRQGKTVSVRTSLHSLPLAAGNPGELREVLTNLILNAVDAMPEGGTLTIATRAEGETVSLSVSDTGTGIPEDIIQHIWEPFFTTKGAAGSGLGLPISQRIVERHGGQISVESKLGEGSTFTIRLPAFAAAPAAPPPANVQTILPGHRILVVDDEPDVIAILQRMLTREGQEVITAQSGAEGLAALESASYDMVLTDLGMPDMSGVAIAHRARQINPDMPVILVTGWEATITPEQLTEMGATGVLAKPFTYAQLRALLAAYLD